MLIYVAKADPKLFKDIFYSNVLIYNGIVCWNRDAFILKSRDFCRAIFTFFVGRKNRIENHLAVLCGKMETSSV